MDKEKKKIILIVTGVILVIVLACLIGFTMVKKDDSKETTKLQDILNDSFCTIILSKDTSFEDFFPSGHLFSCIFLLNTFSYLKQLFSEFFFLPFSLFKCNSIFCTVCEQMDVNEDFSSSYASISLCTYIITGIFTFTMNWLFWIKLWKC